MSLPQPSLNPVPDSGKIMAVNEAYSVVLPLCGRTLSIKPGYTFDGTSEPQAGWSINGITPFDPDFVASSLGHDGLYSAELLPRDQCDHEFKALMMLNSRRSKDNAEELFVAVRAFGELVWMNHTPESIAEARQYCSLSP